MNNSTAPLPRRWTPAAPRPATALAVLAAALASCALAAAALARAAPLERPATPVPVVAAAQEDGLPARARCEICGTIESIRRADDVGGQTAYTFTVLMRDGSRRDSSESSPGHWRVGERIRLIGGAP